MTSPYVFVVTGLLSFAGMGILHKIGDRCAARPLPIALSTMLAAGVLSGVRVFATRSIAMTATPPKILLIAIPFGIATALSIWMFQEGLRFGRIATSWLLINLSAGVPTVLSILIYREPIDWKKSTALVLIVFSLLLLWQDRRLANPVEEAVASDVTTEVL